MKFITRLKPLIKKELAYYFHSPTAYISIGLFVVIINWLFFANFFLVGQVSMSDFFQNVPLVYLLLIPAIGMAAFAEEKRVKTIEVLLTLPLSKTKIVFGKFIAGLLVIILGLLLTLTIPVTLAFLGSPEWGPIITGYMAVTFLGALYLSVGLLVSALTDNQIVSFTITAVICFLFFITGSTFFLDRIPAVVHYPFQMASSLTHFTSMAKGLIDLRDIVYFLTLIGLFLYLTSKKIE
ncbi:ABC transporter permease subunit [Patescibacteria group bacterium]|nr:ABC transporter permease subunit [Patescibacteria group bacterium]MBU1868028.1 ABC transporter permease subunit [Patescibacteria group bacterium]